MGSSSVLEIFKATLPSSSTVMVFPEHVDPCFSPDIMSQYFPGFKDVLIFEEKKTLKQSAMEF